MGPERYPEAAVLAEDVELRRGELALIDPAMRRVDDVAAAPA